jgi:hypothetical protein
VRTIVDFQSDDLELRSITLHAIAWHLALWNGAGVPVRAVFRPETTKAPPDRSCGASVRKDFLSPAGDRLSSAATRLLGDGALGVGEAPASVAVRRPVPPSGELVGALA